MLQQTRVQTVIPYWERFLRELPTVQALAEAPISQVLSLWSGLGYYRRARMLHEAARRVVVEHGGRIPGDRDLLEKLEGVGAYTAGAVASIAFGKRTAAVDGNVARVLARIFAVGEAVSSGKGQARLWAIAEELVPPDGEGDPGIWNQALMELGATVCTPRQPACDECPLRTICLARAQGIVNELPRTAKKKPPKHVRRAAVVLESKAGVLLARRNGGALFGGLWEPPGIDGELAPLAARLGVPLEKLEPAGEVVHVLSHRRLVVAVFRGRAPARRSWPLPGDEYDAVEWVKTSSRGVPADARPHAALTRKILSLVHSTSDRA
jgi:A/G-specific adenine glycosylase